MSLPLGVFGATDRGHVHEKNEDAWAILDTEEGGRLLVVCDGMGGMGRGDEASALAVEVLTGELKSSSQMPPENLRAAIRVADVKVREVLCSDMMGLPGSTAVLVYVIDGAAHVAWVGDSRAYLVRDGTLLQRTRDHKLVEELVDAGQITPQEAKNSTLAHVVTRALGGRGPEEPPVLPSTIDQPWKLDHGDRILLCSDGVCDLLADEEIAALLDDTEPEDAGQQIVQASLDRGGHDNITVIVARWDGPSWVEDDVATPLQVQHRMIEPADLTQDDFGRVTEEIDLDALEAQRGLGAALPGDPPPTDDLPETDDDTGETTGPPGDAGEPAESLKVAPPDDDDGAAPHTPTPAPAPSASGPTADAPDNVTTWIGLGMALLMVIGLVWALYG